MKKILIFTATALTATSLYAKNASFLREPAQGAVVKDASTSLYNPAGSVFLKPGVYASFSSLSVLREWDIETTEQNFGREVFVPMVPEINAVWAKERFSIFANFSVDGGGTRFKNGLPSYNQIMDTSLKAGLALQEQDMKFSNPSNVIDASERLYFINLGSAYKFNDSFSVSLGAKAVSGEKNFDAVLRYNKVESSSEREALSGEYKLKFNEKALGAAPSLAAHLRLDKWAFSAKYDFKVNMAYEVNVDQDDLSPISEAANKDPVAVEGAIENNDIPSQLTLAAKYQFTNRLRTGLTYSRTFFEFAEQDTWQKSMKLKREAYNNPNIKGKPLMNQNAVSASAAYLLTENMTVSGGYAHQDSAANSATSVDDQHKLDFDMYTAGFNTKFNRQSIDVAVTHIRYHDTFNENETQVFGQKDYIFSLGYNFSIN